MEFNEAADLALKAGATFIGVFCGFLFKKTESLEKKVTILESKMDVVQEIKTDLKELKEYVHKNVHAQNNRDTYLQPLIQRMYEKLMRDEDLSTTHRSQRTH